MKHSTAEVEKERHDENEEGEIEEDRKKENHEVKQCDGEKEGNKGRKKDGSNKRRVEINNDE